MLSGLSDLQTFVCVARTLNFTQAAMELHVTPTAVSKAVARLENEINAKLFNRTTRQVWLTEEGELFLERCVAAIAEIEAGLDALEVLKDQTTGPVRISAPYILGRKLAASLPDLITLHAKLDLRLILTDRIVDLAEDRIDIAIRVGTAQSAQTHFVPLAQLNWITVASPRYLQLKGEPDSLEMLKQHQCHHFINPNGELVPWQFDVENEVKTMLPGGGAQFNQGELLVEIARADGGIVQIFDYMVQDELRNGQLVRLFPKLEADGPMLHAVVQPGRENSPKIKATLLYLLELFEQF